jgi:dihydrofolate reductase
MNRTWRGIVFIATSMDGYIARRDHDIGWLTDPDANVNHEGAVGPVGVGSFEALLQRVDHMIMGRGTYDKVRTFEPWPYGSLPVMVLSSSIAVDADDRIRVVRTIDEACEALNAAGSRAAYIDGGRTIQSFLNADLIDEVTVTRAPVLIGDGIPLFGPLEHDVTLALRAVQADASGYVHCRYEVVREGVVKV